MKKMIFDFWQLLRNEAAFCEGEEAESLSFLLYQQSWLRI
jgi:hypothetical protein